MFTAYAPRVHKCSTDAPMDPPCTKDEVGFIKEIECACAEDLCNGAQNGNAATLATTVAVTAVIIWRQWN